MRLPRNVTIVEVGPRDGLQNEARIVPVEHRVALVEALAASGLTVVEAGSFVSARAVPQMAGTEEVLRRIVSRGGTRYPVLVPNATGMRRAIEAGARDVAVFISASEKFSERNINCSIAASLDHAAEVAAMAAPLGIRVRGYVSCTLGCPYQGDVPVEAVAGLAPRLIALGCDEISLGDTIGTGTAQAARHMVETVTRSVPVERLAVHFHDTNGQALANVLACLEAGVAIVDSAVGGLGGCPFADGASGNLATEDLLAMLDAKRVESRVDRERLHDAVALVETLLALPIRSKAFAADRERHAQGGPQMEPARRGAAAVPAGR